MSDCEAFRVEIEDAAGGGGLSGRAAAHAAACSACGEAVRSGEALRALVRGLGRVEAPADFEYRLRARIAASKSGGGGGLFARLRPAGGLAWVAAAVCFVAVSASLYVRQAQLSKNPAAPVVEVARDTAAPTRQNVNESQPAGGQTHQQSGATAGAPGSNQTDAVSKSHAASAKRGASRPRASEIASRVTRNDSAARGSVDAAFNSARVIRPKFTNAGDGAASRVAAQGIQLGTSAVTLRVALRDEHGALVPMRSVSFGSQQEALLRETASRVTARGEEGVW